MRPAIRLAALANYPSIFILSHDSIGLGEDGPTHQPVEHLAALRAIPNLFVFRPADANETKQAWHKALTSDKPTAIILSRQNLPIYPEKTDCINGAYIVSDSPKAKLILIASGSELQLAVSASQELKKHNIASRVVSIPCWELFEQQSLAYKEKILPTKIKKRIAIEAGIKQGWERYLGDEGVFIGMDSFGASAPAEQLFKHNNITVEKIIETAKLNFGFKISKYQVANWQDYLQVSDQDLLKSCQLTSLRGSGKGGQKRNKTSNAIRIKFSVSLLFQKNTARNKQILNQH